MKVVCVTHLHIQAAKKCMSDKTDDVLLWGEGVGGL